MMHNHPTNDTLAGAEGAFLSMLQDGHPGSKGFREQSTAHYVLKQDWLSFMNMTFIYV